ncbi:MAG: hypothetical protein AB6733_09240 [Clostridiaceae bacterium]
MTTNSMMSILTSYKKTSAFIAAFKLGIFQEIVKENISAALLANKLSIDEDMLELMLNYFESEGILLNHEDCWSTTDEYKVFLDNIDDYKDIISHEENLFNHWITPKSIVSALKSGISNREFDFNGLSKEENEIYNKAMYGKNIEIMSFWIKREIKNITNIQLIEYGRSQGVVTKILKKQQLKFNGDIVVNDEYYSSCRDNFVDSDVNIHKISEFKETNKYNVFILFNSVHYFSEKKFRDILNKIKGMMLENSVLCIADIFYKPSDEFSNGLLLDWITHGGIYNTKINEITNNLINSGFEVKKIKNIPEISTDLIFAYFNRT